MKFIKLLTSLLVVSFFIMPSYAAGLQTPFSWVQTNDGTAGVVYDTTYNEEVKILVAEIDHSSSGYQGLYFRDYYAENTNVCKYRTTTPDSVTMIFNGQAVKMLRWCQQFVDAKQYYFNLTPETDRGESYVINLFKVAISPIKIQYNNETLYFPVIGFTKAWNSAGGNAI